MADDSVRLQPDSTGKRVDCSVVTVGLNAVERQRINISDPSDANAHAAVITGTPTTEYGLVVRQAGTSTVTIGTVAVDLNAGLNQIGSVTAIISGTPTVTFGQTIVASGTITANLGNSIPTGANLLGTVTANIGNTPTVTFGTATVTFGQAVIASGTITANIGSSIPTGANLLGTVTANIGNTPTVTFGTATVQGTVTANIVGTVTIGSTVTANFGNSIPAGANAIGYVTIRGSLAQDALQASDKSLIFTGQGYQAEAGAVAGNPMLIAGSNSGFVKTFVTDANGAMVSVITAGVKQIGSVTATISGTPTVTFGSIAGTISTNINAGANQIGSVTATLSGTSNVSEQAGAVVTGQVFTNQTATVTSGLTTVSGMSTLIVSVTGTWTGSIVTQNTSDDVTFGTMNFSSGGLLQSTITANGQYLYTVAGYKSVQFGFTAASGGVYLATRATPIVSPHRTVQLSTSSNQIGSVTATISGTSTVTFGSAVIASGTITANLGSAIPAGAAQIGSVTATISGTATVAGTVTANSSDIPNPAGGWTPFLSTSVTGTAQTITGIAGNLGGYNIYNPNTSVAYVQIFDAATVTVGTTTAKQSYGIPPLASEVLDSSKGINFTNSMKVAATTAVAGATGVTTGVVFNAWYKTA